MILRKRWRASHHCFMRKGELLRIVSHIPYQKKKHHSYRFGFIHGPFRRSSIAYFKGVDVSRTCTIFNVITDPTLERLSSELFSIFSSRPMTLRPRYRRFSTAIPAILRAFAVLIHVVCPRSKTPQLLGRRPVSAILASGYQASAMTATQTWVKPI